MIRVQDAMVDSVFNEAGANSLSMIEVGEFGTNPRFFKLPRPCSRSGGRHFENEYLGNHSTTMERIMEIA